MERHGRTAAVLTADYFPPELQRLCRTAAAVLHEHVACGGLCVVCSSAWPCERARLAERNLALL
jgi:hypothetical protein